MEKKQFSQKQPYKNTLINRAPYPLLSATGEISLDT